MPRNPYLVLGVQADADGEEIRRAYRSRALQCHPDKRQPEEREAGEQLFKDLGQAYEILRDPVKRRAFDAVHCTVGSCQRPASQGGAGLAASTRRRPGQRRPQSQGTWFTSAGRAGRHRGFPFSSFTSPQPSEEWDASKESRQPEPTASQETCPPNDRPSTGAAPKADSTPSFGSRIWFARGSACVGRAYKGQEAEELSSGRQAALLAAAAWLCSGSDCLLEVRGCTSRGEVPLRQQEALGKSRCEKAMNFLNGQGGVSAEMLRVVPAKTTDCFQGVELTGMRRLNVNGTFLSDTSLLLNDEAVLPAVTKFLVSRGGADAHMLFLEIVFSEDQHLAARRRAALAAALVGSSGAARRSLGLAQRVAAGVRRGLADQVNFYTLEKLPLVDESPR